jgi:hypothetical protein
MNRSIDKLLNSDAWAALAGHPYYAPAAELARRLKRKSEPTETEAISLALVGMQGHSAMYLQPNGPTAEETLQEILHILDHQVVVQAVFLTLHRVLREQPGSTEAHSLTMRGRPSFPN